jgi:hypothetical protein
LWKIGPDPDSLGSLDFPEMQMVKSVGTPARIVRAGRSRTVPLLQFVVKQDVEAKALGAALCDTILGPHERTPSWEGQDVFTVCDVLPFPNIPIKLSPAPK